MESITVDRNGRTGPVKKERRHNSRMAVNGLTYVNLGRDNGGIVLNISEGGLCFQSRAPVRTVETIRLWFSNGGQRSEARVGQGRTNEASRGGVSQFIEARGELAWIDDTRKLGGLRFKNLPEEAQEQIREWIHEPAFAFIRERPSPHSRSVKGPTWSVKRASKSVAQVCLARLEELFSLIGTARRRTGFSGGVVSGILLSAVLAGLFSFLIKSHMLGDSLVRLGERLGGRVASPAAATNAEVSPPPSPKPQPPPLERESVSAETQAIATRVQDPPPDKFLSTAAPTVAKSAEGKPEAVEQGTPWVSRAAARPLVPARPSVPKMVMSPAAESHESMVLLPAPQMLAPTRLDVHTEPSKIEGANLEQEKYLEVGKFNDKPLAETLVGRLAQLDFPAKVSQSSRFFGKSYQVLVGPYGSDSEAEVMHKNLSSHGFTPRSYERGKREFSLRSGLKVGAARLPVGTCEISWESYAPDAIVKIETLRGERVTLEGKWVERDGKYHENSIAYVKDRDGTLALLEIRFSGLKEALVFGGGSRR